MTKEIGDVKPRRVLFFNYEYPPLGGGAGNASAAIMREYAKRTDIEVDFVTSSLDSEYHLETFGDGRIRIHRLPIGKNPDNLTYQSQKEIMTYAWKAYWFASRLVREQQYDLSHAFFTVPCGVLSLVLKYRYGLPYIVSLRGSDVPGFSERFTGLYTFLRPVIVRIWKQAAAVIACSRGLGNLAHESNPKQEIGIIYNGIDTERFKPAPSDLRDDTKFTVLCASRLSRRKGFRYAIEAFAQLVKSHPEVRLFIAGGEGDAEQELFEQVRKLGIYDSVTFFGYVPNSDFPRYYNAADVFVFPSLNEGMSNSMLEAMACGLPIIMTPTGGAEELVEDGGNGFIVPFRESGPIAERLELLAKDRDMVKHLGARSRAIAEKMSWASIAEAYMVEYRKASRV